MNFYVFAAIFATLTFTIGCTGPGPDGTGGGTGSGGEPTTTATDECGGACVSPQVCGIGCGESIGCYTPGGSMTPGPNDCPTCFPTPPGGECVNTGLTFFCQPGAFLTGCTSSPSAPGYVCCPPAPDAG